MAKDKRRTPATPLGEVFVSLADFGRPLRDLNTRSLGEVFASLADFGRQLRDQELKTRSLGEVFASYAAFGRWLRDQELKTRSDIWAFARYDLGMSAEEWKHLTARQFKALYGRWLAAEARADRRAGIEEAQSAAGPKIEWPGTERALAAEIISRFQRGDIKANSERDAVLKTAPRYVVRTKDGRLKPIKPESLYRNYYQQTR